jgi:cation diffusion facilitator family transporter
MATLLRRFFIRDYQNVSDESVRSAHGRVAAAFGLATNFLLVAIKFGLAIYLWSLVNFGAGLLSMALVSDAVNNLSDMATCLVTLEGFRMSDKPADKEHPFGHERIEYIAGLIISVTVVALAIQLFRDSLTSVINGVTVDYSILTVVLLGLSVLIKL